MRIYVAGPYAHGAPARNVRRAIDAAEALLARGHHPFVPHLNHFWHARHPHDRAVWLALDLAWLPFAEGVLRLPGPSDGADRECRAARERGIPVYGALDDVPSFAGRSP